MTQQTSKEKESALNGADKAIIRESCWVSR